MNWLNGSIAFSFFHLQASRDYVVGQIMLACTEIIKIVEARGDLDQSLEEPGYMAATLEKVCEVELQEISLMY